jgi:hypothetical protein
MGTVSDKEIKDDEDVIEVTEASPNLPLLSENKTKTIAGNDKGKRHPNAVVSMENAKVNTGNLTTKVTI